MAVDESDKREPKKRTDVSAAFVLSDVLPNAADAFGFSQVRIEDAVKKANIVLDANVLLLPYGAGGKSIGATGEIYKNLASDGRLFVPAQALREYLKNRPKKISELLQSLTDAISRIAPPPEVSYPILEGIDQFRELEELIVKYKQLRKEILQAREKLSEIIVAWKLKDPVLEVYRKSIPVSSIKEIAIDREKAIQELERRYALAIPPGYKDSTKEDGGIGDYLIWRTILCLGEETKKSTIFVSGDEKPDWQHRSNNAGFMPRFELIDEYRRSSSGGSFFIVSLSSFLELLHTKPELVSQIRREEEKANDSVLTPVECPYCLINFVAYLAAPIGSSATPVCAGCKNKFHVHRTRDGVISRQWGMRSEVQPSFTVVSTGVGCPACGAGNEVMLGSDVGSTRWTYCKDCGSKISAHRQSDGGVFVNIHGHDEQ